MKSGKETKQTKQKQTNTHTYIQKTPKKQTKNKQKRKPRELWATVVLHHSLTGTKGWSEKGVPPPIIWDVTYILQNCTCCPEI